MSWKKTEGILAKQLTNRGLQPSISAGMVCKEAERLYPGLFRAIFIRNTVLTVAAQSGNRLQIKLIEGALVRQVNEYAERHSLPQITRVRLTIEE